MKTIKLFILVIILLLYNNESWGQELIPPIVMKGAVYWSEGGAIADGYGLYPDITIGFEDNAYPNPNKWANGYVWYDLNNFPADAIVDEAYFDMIANITNSNSNGVMTYSLYDPVTTSDWNTLTNEQKYLKLEQTINEAYTVNILGSASLVSNKQLSNSGILDLTYLARTNHYIGISLRENPPQNDVIGSDDTSILEWSDFSLTIRYANTPSSISPSGTISTLTPTLTWNGSVAGLLYCTFHVQISNSSTFSSIIWEESNLTATTITVPTGFLSGGQQYYWRVFTESSRINITAGPTGYLEFTTPNETYYLTMIAGTGGSVTPSSGWRNDGENVEISATPNNSYSFAGWTGSGNGSYSGTNNSVTIVMNDNITQTANFSATSNWIQDEKLLANDGAESDLFGEGGQSVSISGDYAIVGAYGDDDNGSNSGSAYIFKREGSNWIQEAKLFPNDGETGEYFGVSVSISGNYAIVGAKFDSDNGSSAGSAYIFKRSGTNWNQVAKLLANDGDAGDSFGGSVSISGDYVVIGAWPDDDNGSNSGSAYIFKNDGSTWIQESKLLSNDGAAGDRFGWSVSISGDYVIVGSELDDDNGNESGSAYIFKRNGTTWNQQTKLLANDGATSDRFGISVSIWKDKAIVGAYADDNYKGSAYVYTYTGGGWIQEQKLVANDGVSGDYFGTTLSISGNYAIVGAKLNDDNGIESGSAYIFKFDGSSWSEEEKLLASDGVAYDFFGSSVAISNNSVIVGAYGDDENGNEAGAAYIFKNSNLLSNLVRIQTEPIGLSFSVDGINFSSTQEFIWESSSNHTILTTTQQSGGIDTQYVWSNWNDGGGIIHTVSPNSDTIYTANFSTQYYLTMNAETGGSVSPSSGWRSSGENLEISATPNSEYSFTSWTGNGSGSYTGISNPVNITMNGPIIETAAFNQNGESWIQFSKLEPSDGLSEDRFGNAVSIADDYAIVGTFFDDDNGNNSGSAYIFKYDGISWIQDNKLLPSDGGIEDYFGVSVSISGDYAIVGAFYDDDNGSESGSAYIFKREESNWIQETKLLPSDGSAGDNFSYNVSISTDYAVVGAPYNDDNGSNSGSAYIFKREGSNWIQEAKLLANDGAADDEFGTSVSISGDYVAVGVPLDDDNGSNSGSTYIFKREGSNWIQEARLLPNDGTAYSQFGEDVSISGYFIVVGATYSDASGESSGSAYIFKREGSNWLQEATLLPNDGAAYDYFGHWVSISNNYTVIGSWRDDDNGSSSGSAYIFKREAGIWIQESKLLADDGSADDNLGWGVSISNNFAILGAYGNDDNGSNSGSAYIFQNTALNNGLLVYYPFDGNTDDKSGNNINGIAYGDMQFVEDRFGNQSSAYYFDGYGDYIAFGYPTINSQSFSVCAWLKTTGLHPDEIYQMFFGGRYAVSGNEYTLIQMAVETDDGDSLLLSIDGSESNNRSTLYKNISLFDNGWHFWCVTSDTDTLRLYINGIEVGNVHQSALGDLPDNCVLGGFATKYENNNFEYEHFYKGVLDDFRLYDHPLTSYEIQSLFQEGGWNGNIRNYALSFDGIDDYVTSNLITDLGTDYTIEFLAKFNDLPDGYSTLFFRGNSPTCDYEPMIQINNATNEVEARVSGCSGGGVFALQNVLPDLWYHYAITVSGSTQKFIMNGVVISVGSETSKSISQYFSIGSQPGYNFLDGVMDEIKVWNRERNISDIRNTMYDTLSFDYYNTLDSGLVAYWRFDGDLSDLTQNENDGLINGDPTFIVSDAPIGEALICTNLKVFLEGPYSGSDTMTTTLNTNNLIPLNSNDAYSNVTYGYTASVVGSIPNSNIVDWVLIELRTGIASVTKVATRAAFLKKDGTVVDVDGYSPVIFTTVSPGNYYVVVRHRNHLAIMSASAITLNGNSSLYDFSTAQTQAYGSNPMKSLTGGGFGMITGDASSDGSINATDLNDFWIPQNGIQYNYLTTPADFNLDGTINATDLNIYWIPNNGVSTQVPTSIFVSPVKNLYLKSNDTGW